MTKIILLILHQNNKCGQFPKICLWNKRELLVCFIRTLLIYRKNRNLYAQLLLHMVKRGLLEDPFTRRPEAGPLQALPSYMVGLLLFMYVVVQIFFLVSNFLKAVEF